MLSELIKDIKYIARTSKECFQFVTVFKISILPMIITAFGFAGEYFEFLILPSHIWVLISIITVCTIILFTIARRARKLEEPVFSILCENTPDYLVPINQFIINNHFNYGLKIRILPKASAYAYASGIINSVSYQENGEWVSTPLNESLNLVWSNTEYTRENIFPDHRKFLDIIEIWDTGKHIPCVNPWPDHVKNAFSKEGIYKFDIIIESGGPYG